MPQAEGLLVLIDSNMFLMVVVPPDRLVNVRLEVVTVPVTVRLVDLTFPVTSNFSVGQYCYSNISVSINNHSVY